MKTLKILLIALGFVAILWFSAPFLTGILFRFSAHSHYHQTPPTKISTLSIPGSDITISLFRKARPRAITYEGEFRILEVSQPAKSNLYFEIWPTWAGDKPDLKACWYPASRCVKLVDSGLMDGPKTALVLLDAAEIVELDAVGKVLGSRSATASLQFPLPADHSSLPLKPSAVSPPEGEGVLIGILEEP